MAEELWHHALQFLDKYRTDIGNYDISHLYQFEDKTGILERHKERFETLFLDSQVDMKIIFYELIRMLVDYERSVEQDVFDDTRTIPKIEGYQELTNKLQRHLTQQLFIDLQELKKFKFKGTEDESNQYDKDKFVQLESKLQQVEQCSMTIMEKVLKLEMENKSLLDKIETLEKNDEKLFLEVDKDDQKGQNQPFDILQNLVEKHEEQISNIVKTNDDQDAKIELIEHKAENLELTIDNWREDFETQERFEIIENKISDLKKLPLSHIVEQVNDLMKHMEEEKEWTEQRINDLEKKCQIDLIQNQTDIMSNTKEMTKVIENQMLVNEKIKLIPENLKNNTDSIINVVDQNSEGSNQLADSRSDKSDLIEARMKSVEISQENMCSELAGIGESSKTFERLVKQNIDNIEKEIDKAKEAINKFQNANPEDGIQLRKNQTDFELKTKAALESFALNLSNMKDTSEKNQKSIARIEKHSNEQIDSTKRETDKVTVTIMEEISSTSEKIEALKKTTHNINDKLEESNMQERSQILEDMNKMSFSIEDLQNLLLCQEERHKDTAVKIAQLSLGTSDVQQEIRENSDKNREIFRDIYEKIDNMEKLFVGKESDKPNILKVDEPIKCVNDSEIRNIQCFQALQIIDEKDRKTNELKQGKGKPDMGVSDNNQDHIDTKMKLFLESVSQIQKIRVDKFDEEIAVLKIKIQEISDSQNNS
eukprot:GFUD01006200.1.p1 GENE.GFUD01006200.1~~GFUD01006200.1.p1  ORF type:complete len:709 (+),score=240.81 GFUD01006200.1:35-2161(+)